MRRVVVFLFAIGILAALTVEASDLRGMNRIAGTVSDPGGAGLAGVTVRATLESDGTVTMAQSDASGAWAVGGLVKGEWVVMFVKPGFTPQKARVVLPADMSRVPPIKIVLKKE